MTVTKTTTGDRPTTTFYFTSEDGEQNWLDWDVHQDDTLAYDLAEGLTTLAPSA